MGKGKAIQVLVLAVIMSAQALSGADNKQKRVVQVGNTEQLYEAVNGPLNANTEIHLAPNTYKLTSADPAGLPRPNGGRLELPPGADLRGSNQYLDEMESRGLTATGELIFADVATESIIDAALLPFGAFAIPPARTGVLRVGRDNEVSHLTIRNSLTALALIEIDMLPESGGMLATVSRCVIENGAVGVDFRHFLGPGSGRDSTAFIERNVIRHQSGTLHGFGIRLLNNNRVHGSTLRATIEKNRIYDNNYGLHAEALGSSDHEIYIESKDNIYENNGTGIGLEGGAVNLAVTTESSRNRLEFASKNDSIWNNNRTAALGAFQITGGVVVRGAVNGAVAAGEASDNTVTVSFHKPQFVKRTAAGALEGIQNRGGSGERLDVAIYGAHGLRGISAGRRNRAEITIKKGESDEMPNAFRAIDARPADGPTVAPADRNRAVVVSSNLEFVYTEP